MRVCGGGWFGLVMGVLSAWGLLILVLCLRYKSAWVGVCRFVLFFVLGFATSVWFWWCFKSWCFVLVGFGV